MALYEVPDHALKNLLEFLKRTDLKGAEIPAFNEVISCFMKPVVKGSDSIESQDVRD